MICLTVIAIFLGHEVDAIGPWMIDGRGNSTIFLLGHGVVALAQALSDLGHGIGARSKSTIVRSRNANCVLLDHGVDDLSVSFFTQSGGHKIMLLRCLLWVRSWGGLRGVARLLSGVLTEPMSQLLAFRMLALLKTMLVLMVLLL